MSEYLAPGVYVEEIPSGNKPIAAASTSTAAAVGLTERGPINTPTLCTSLGSYNRQFGGILNPLVFMNNQDALPYAAQGFFNNGGSRLYVTRIIGDNASESTLQMVAHDTSRSASPVIFSQTMANDKTLMLSSSTDLNTDDELLISDGSNSEMVTVNVTSPLRRIAIETGLINTYITNLIGTLAEKADAGSTMLTLDNVTNLTKDDELLISEDVINELITIKEIDKAKPIVTLKKSLDNNFTNAAIITNYIDTLKKKADTGDTTLTLNDVTDLTVGNKLLISEGTKKEWITIEEIDNAKSIVTLAKTLDNSYKKDAIISYQVDISLQKEIPVNGKFSEKGSVEGTTFKLDTMDGLKANDILLIHEDTIFERIKVASVEASTKIVTLTIPFVNTYTNAAKLFLLTDSDTTLRLNADAIASGARVILDLSDPASVSIGDFLRMNNGSDEELVQITAMPEIVKLDTAITANHIPGVALIPAVNILSVHARYPGIWGDALRATAYPAMQVQTVSVGLVPPASNQITVGSAFGLFPGSILILGDPDTTDTDASGLITTAEVESVDTSTGIVTLTASIGAEIPAKTPVSSQEFTLLIERIEDDKAVESEIFERLSMASEHPRYALDIVGSWDTNTEQPSESGGSQLIRLSSNADATTRVLPLVSSLGQMLVRGTDDLGSINDNTYIGNAANDPNARTGIQSMENETTLSIVAVPGQTSVNVQKALLAHCEKMRYRFAVLDTPLASTLKQAREHRQNFDNTRAAIYYPGLVIADPFGKSGDTRTIHPSGHMMGIYARTDVARGVHKAPANEVVRSILNFEVALAKGEQDILNPINLNCFRDFRTENRGLRAYGGRVATSDPEWRYINVRRLLLFIEQSLDTGLQWAVFEPNDTPLWDTIKQSVTNFLTTVWRSGALEGTKQEEAFFVRIGYDITMTQDDIDNGRLIVEIGVAPVKPAEFIIARISQKTREATG